MKRVLILTIFLLLVVGCTAPETFVVTADNDTKETTVSENDKETTVSENHEAKDVITDKLPVLAAAAATKAAEAATQEADGATQEAEGATQEAEAATQEAELPTGTWDRSPNTIILQLREGGGFRLAPSATELPQWTLYGDGMVIWTDGAATPTAGFTEAVWIGTLSDTEINELIAFADEIGFWSLDASYSINDAGQQIETDNGIVITQPQIADLPSGTLTFNLVDRQHAVLMYPSDYEGMPKAYEALRQRMLATRPTEATTYTASTFRLEAHNLGPIDSLVEGTRALLVEWSFADIALADVTQAPQTLDGKKGFEVGNFLIEQGNYIVQDGVGYEVKLFAEAPRPTTNQ